MAAGEGRPDPTRQRGDQGDWRPRPDPTALTTEQLHRETGVLRELLELRIGAVEASLVAESAEIRRLFERVMNERDRRYEERFQAGQQAIASALAAAEKAVNHAVANQERAVAAAFESSEKAISKAETSIEKRADATYVQLAELQRILSALMPREESEARYRGLEEQVNSIGSRVDKIEARAGGMGSLAGALMGAAGVIVAAIGIAAAILRG